MGAVLGKFQGYGLSDSTARAGDEGYFIFEELYDRSNERLK